MSVSEITGPGAHHWTCPEGVTSVEVEVQGASSSDGTPGEVVRDTVPVIPGRIYKMHVGEGGTVMTWDDAESWGAVTITRGGGGGKPGRLTATSGEHGHITIRPAAD